MPKTFGDRFIWRICLVYLLAIITLIFITHDHRNETHHYLHAAWHWCQGKNIYNHKGTDFIYFPFAAIVFIPFGYLPHLAGEIIWRTLSFIVFIFGIKQLSTLATENNNSVRFLMMIVLSLAIGFDGIRNGQMNIIMAGFCMLGISELKNEKWWLSTLYLTLAFALKPTAIVIWLLIAALFPKMSWRLVLGLLLAFLLPFLTQHTNYVLTQYQACFSMLCAAANLGSSGPVWAQFFGMLGQLFNMVVPAQIEYLIRIIAAGIIFMLCYLCLKNYDRKTALIYIYTLGVCYLMLFNPRTENNDYCILAPCIGYFLVNNLTRASIAAYFRLSLIIIISISLAGSYYLSHLVTPDENLWLAPLMTICFLSLVLWHILAPKKIIIPESISHG